MLTDPVITIIMATYNRAHLIAQTLDSIQNQSFEEWECLIIDDGSTDQTHEILTPYLEKENRFKYYKRLPEYGKGLPGCRNYGLDIASGKYIIFFDDDDIVHPENLKLSLYELEKSDVSYCRFLRETFTGEFLIEFDPSRNYTTNSLDISDLPDIITGIIPFNSCQILWEKECFKNNRFNESLMYAEEWDCFSRILITGVKGINIQKVLFYGRKHPESNTGEFWKKDELRRESNIRAVKIVFNNLFHSGNLSTSLTRYFLQLGIFLENESIIKLVLNTIKAKKIEIWKYNILFKFYPYIVWIHRLRKKLTTTQS